MLIATLVVVLLLPLAVTPRANAQSTPATTKAAAVIIETAALSEVVIHPQRELAASVMARNESKLSAEVSGVVLRWTAEAGSTVKKGEVLVVIDPVDFRLAVAQAQAAVDASLVRLKQAEQQLKRSQALVRQGFFSQEALHPARNRSGADAQRTGIATGPAGGRSTSAGEGDAARAFRRQRHGAAGADR
jgi:multidrug efflux pump subunit AcrA (membrane-fusion protein)